MFSSYGGDGHSKLVFVQRRQDSCLVTMDTIGWYTIPMVWTLLDRRRETEGHFLVGIVILGFLTIYKKS